MSSPPICRKLDSEPRYARTVEVMKILKCTQQPFVAWRILRP
jgi:hypothetical protein